MISSSCGDDAHFLEIDSERGEIIRDEVDVCILVRPDRISSPITSTAAVTVRGRAHAWGGVESEGRRGANATAERMGQFAQISGKIGGATRSADAFCTTVLLAQSFCSGTRY